MTTQNTVIRAWMSETNNRSMTDGFIFHSDRDLQYDSDKYLAFFLAIKNHIRHEP